MKKVLPVFILILLVLAIGFLLWINFLPEETLRSFVTSPKQSLKQVTSPIQAVSDLPEFSLSLAGPKRLDRYLTDFGFWQKDNVVFRGTREKATVRRLVIHLTDQEQKYDQITSEETGVYQASGEIFSNGQLDLFIFIAPEILAKEEEVRLTQRIDGQVLRTVYNLTHLGLETEDRRQSLAETLKEISNELTAENLTLFRLVRLEEKK